MIRDREKLIRSLQADFISCNLAPYSLKYVFLGEEENRREALEFTAGELEEMLEAGSKSPMIYAEGSEKILVQDHDIEIYEPDEGWEQELLDDASDFYGEDTFEHSLAGLMRRIRDGHREGQIFIPLFHNAHLAGDYSGIFMDRWTDFVWQSWDNKGPCLLSLPEDAYGETSMSGGLASRLNCFEEVIVGELDEGLYQY